MSAGPREKYQLRTYSDRPVGSVDQDAFGFVSYADAFALLMNDGETSTPLTVAISGPWGSGKTSLAQLLEIRLTVEEYWGLDWQTPPVTCWFNALLHRDAPHLGAALAASVTRQISVARPWLWRVLSPLPSAMLSPQKRAWRRVWTGVAVAGLALLGLMAVLMVFPETRTGLGALGRLFDHWSGVAFWAALPVVVTVLRSAFGVGDSLGTFVDAPRSAAALGTLNEVREQLGRIIRQAQRRRRGSGGAQRRVVIFVDDLERCPPEKALDICEVAAQLLGHDDVITVLVADFELMESAAGARYRPVLGPEADPVSLATLGQEYLHKLIQLRFNLPPLDRAGMAAALGIDKPRGESE